MLLTILFVIGLIMIIISLSNENKIYTPSQNFINEKNKQDMINDIFFNPSPWQQLNYYTQYKGNQFINIPD